MDNLSNKEGAYTPGPWAIISYSNYFGFSISSPDGACIAERWYQFERSDQQNEAMRANARLIAAAPELLEALKQARIVLGEAGSDEHVKQLTDKELGKLWIAVTKMADKAITEAEGRS